MNEEHQIKGGFFKKLKNIFKITPKPPQNIQELLTLINQSEQNSIINPDVASMINSVIQVSEIRVSDIMIPSNQMVYLDINDDSKKNLEVILESGHSRFPLIDVSKDKVIGILLAKDIIHWLINKKNEKIDNFDIKKFIRQAIFVPENKRLNIILQEFRRNRNHLAIVVDEYGNTSGIITIEDVLEQIVGDITDEHDVEENNILKHSDIKFTVKAQTSITDFNEYFKSNLSVGNVNTIGGFVVNLFGNLPKRNDSIKYEDFSFKVLHCTKRRINLLQVGLLNHKLNN